MKTVTRGFILALLRSLGSFCGVLAEARLGWNTFLASGRALRQGVQGGKRTTIDGAQARGITAGGRRRSRGHNLVWQAALCVLFGNGGAEGGRQGRTRQKTKKATSSWTAAQPDDQRKLSRLARACVTANVKSSKRSRSHLSLSAQSSFAAVMLPQSLHSINLASNTATPVSARQICCTPEPTGPSS